jgi:hypothetical protein
MIRFESRDSYDAIFHLVDGVEYVQCAMVVGNDDDSSAMLSGDIAKEFHDLPTPMAIERSGRFISQQDARG